jgi:Na+-transporting methylmalonyl-CoA/oxaloacetate decarboxylase gamma subunit
MATVFAFLVLLVVSMQASAAFFKKYAHLFPEEPVKTAAPAANPAAAIAVALAAIRAKRG